MQYVHQYVRLLDTHLDAHTLDDLHAQCGLIEIVFAFQHFDLVGVVDAAQAT